MGFLFNGDYLSDSYFKYLLTSSAKMTSSDNYDNSETEKINDQTLLNKLNINLENHSLEDLIKTFMDLIDKENIDKYSAILLFDRPQLMAVLYLLQSGKLTIDDLDKILNSSNRLTRTELLLSYLDSDDITSSDEVDIFAPLKAFAKRYSGNFKNFGEKVFSRKEGEEYLNKNIESIKPISGLNYLSYGSYRYRSQKSDADIFDSCDWWKTGDEFPDDTFTYQLFSDPNVNLSELLKEKALNPIEKIDTIASIFSSIFSTIFHTEPFIDPVEEAARREATKLYGFNSWWNYEQIYSKWTSNKLLIPIDIMVNDVFGTVSAKCAELDFNNRLKMETIDKNIPTNVSGCLRYSYISVFDTLIWKNSTMNIVSTTAFNSNQLPFNYYSKLYNFIYRDDDHAPIKTLNTADTTNLRKDIDEFDDTALPRFISGEENTYLNMASKIEKKLDSRISELVHLDSNGEATGANVLNNANFRNSLLNHTLVENNIDFSKLYDDMDLKYTMVKWLIDYNLFMTFSGDFPSSKIISILLSNMLISDPISSDEDLYVEIMNFGTMPINNAIIRITDSITNTLRKTLGEKPFAAENIKERTITEAIDVLNNMDTLTINNSEGDSNSGNSLTMLDEISNAYATMIVRNYLDYLLGKKDSILDSFKLIISTESENKVDEAKVGTWLYRYYKMLYFIRHSIYSFKDINDALESNDIYNSLKDGNTTGSNGPLDNLQKYYKHLYENYSNVSMHNNPLSDILQFIYDKTLESVREAASLLPVVEYQDGKFPREDNIEIMKEKTILVKD